MPELHEANPKTSALIALNKELIDFNVAVREHIARLKEIMDQLGDQAPDVEELNG